MNTYCPACGINVNAALDTAGGRRSWRCATCGLVLKEEPGAASQPAAARTEGMVTRIPLAKAPARHAPPPPARIQASALPWQPGKPAGKQPAAGSASIDLDEGDPGEFVLEALGEERRIEVGAPAASGRSKIDLDEGDPGEFVLEAGGEERRIDVRQAAPAAPSPASHPAAARPMPAAQPAQAARAQLVQPQAQAAPAQATAPRAAPPADPFSGPSAASPFAAPAAQAPAQQAGARPAIFERVIVAEDTALLREVTKDVLTSNGISREVITCANGEELLRLMAESLARRTPVSLAIVDVEMPVLNGYYAAIALRAFERGLGVAPTPIVFFSSLACDETFRKVLEYCQPARYLNKGTDAMAPRIAMRLAQVLATLRR